MRFNGLDLNLLVALDAVLTDMNISRAAERVFLSQSAMSSALGRLRDYFKDDLVVQVGRRLVMTPLAEGLRQPVRDVLLRVDSTITARPKFDPLTADRSFSLLVSDYMTSVLIPQLMVRAAADAPKVCFNLLPQASDPAEMLERGDADLLLIPEQWSSEVHPLERLFEDTYVCVVWEGNTRVGDTLSFDDFLALGHVAVQAGGGPGGGPTAAFDGWFLRRFGMTRRVEVHTPYFAGPPRLVVGTERVATVHKRLALQFAHLPLRMLKPPIDIPKLSLVMQWHKYRSHDPGLLWLREELQAAASAMNGSSIVEA